MIVDLQPPAAAAKRRTVQSRYGPLRRWRRVVTTTASDFTDSWTMGRRLTLNLGARDAHDTGLVPEFSARLTPRAGKPRVHRQGVARKNAVATTSGTTPRSLTPSRGVLCDGDGKTRDKGGWGRFDHQRQQVPELDAADAMVRTLVVTGGGTSTTIFATIQEK